jgi:hypothetical protein
MKMFKSLEKVIFNTCFLVFLCLTAVTELNAQTISLTSPNKNITYAFRRGNQSPVYSIIYKNDKLLVDAPLWLNFTEGGKFAKDLSFGQRTFRTVNDEHGYNEVTIPIKERSGLQRHVNLIVRAYDDGIALKYDSVGEDKWMALTIKNDHPGFPTVEDPKLLSVLNVKKINDETSVKPMISSGGANSAASSVLNSSSWHFMKIDADANSSNLLQVQNSYSKSK